MTDRNYYGLPITPPEQFEGEHVPNVPPIGGLPPVCACGWTRHEVDGHWFEMSDHLADMRGETVRENRDNAETAAELRRRQAPLDVLREETEAMRDAYAASDPKHPDHHETFADIADMRED